MGIRDLAWWTFPTFETRGTPYLCIVSPRAA